MSGCENYFLEAKYKNFGIHTETVFKEYEKHLEKISNITEQTSSSQSVTEEKYLKTKIKSYNGKIITGIYDKKIPEEGSYCLCLAAVVLDSVCKIKIKYYPQVDIE